MFTGHTIVTSHSLHKLGCGTPVPATLQTGDALICPQAADS